MKSSKGVRALGVASGGGSEFAEGTDNPCSVSTSRSETCRIGGGPKPIGRWVKSWIVSPASQEPRSGIAVLSSEGVTRTFRGGYPWLRNSAAIAQVPTRARRLAFKLAAACVEPAGPHVGHMTKTETMDVVNDDFRTLFEPALRYERNQRRIRRARRFITTGRAGNSELLAAHRVILNDYLAYARWAGGLVLSNPSVDGYIFSWCDDPDDTVCHLLVHLQSTMIEGPLD